MNVADYKKIPAKPSYAYPENYITDAQKTCKNICATSNKCKFAQYFFIGKTINKVNECYIFSKKPEDLTINKDCSQGEKLSAGISVVNKSFFKKNSDKKNQVILTQEDSDIWNKIAEKSYFDFYNQNYLINPGNSYKRYRMIASLSKTNRNKYFACYQGNYQSAAGSVFSGCKNYIAAKRYLLYQYNNSVLSLKYDEANNYRFFGPQTISVREKQAQSTNRKNRETHYSDYSGVDYTDPNLFYPESSYTTHTLGNEQTLAGFKTRTKWSRLTSHSIVAKDGNTFLLEPSKVYNLEQPTGIIFEEAFQLKKIRVTYNKKPGREETDPNTFYFSCDSIRNRILSFATTNPSSSTAQDGSTNFEREIETKDLKSQNGFGFLGACYILGLHKIILNTGTQKTYLKK